MKLKKILIISPYFYPHTGGSQQYIEEIAHTLSNKGLDIDVLTYNTDNAEKVQKYRNLTIYRIPCFEILKGQFAIPNPFSLLLFLSDHLGKYQLLYCNTRFFDSTLWALLIAKLTHKKIIITDHCAFYPVHQSKLITFIAKYIDKYIFASSMKFFDIVITTNLAAKKFLEKEFKIESTLIYGGINKELFYPKKKKIGKKIRILYVGRLIESKGVLLLFKIARNNPYLDFVFAGPGPLYNILSKQVKKENLNNIKILGNQTKQQLNSLFAQTDIVVHPSYHHEGFPNVLTEAGSAKSTVIATDIGGTNEIIINGKTGILIPPKNEESLQRAIILLASNDKLRDQYAFNLYSYVNKQFNWKKSADKIYKLVSNLFD